MSKRQVSCFRIMFMVMLTVQLSVAVSGQRELYTTRNGRIDFISDAPLEMIKARSVHMEGVVDVNAHTFAFAVGIKSFEGFNNSLQQQHFYDNYLEANKFPKATFSGKMIEQIDLSEPGTYQVRAKGQLIIHGVTQERIIRVDIVSSGKEINIKSAFIVPLVDHRIEVPKIVNQKIAQEIDITVQAILRREERS